MDETTKPLSQQFAVLLEGRTMDEVIAAGVWEASDDQRRYFQILLDRYTQTTDDELIALCRWFRGNSRLEGHAFDRGIAHRIRG